MPTWNDPDVGIINDFKAAIVAMLHEAKVTALETIENI